MYELIGLEKGNWNVCDICEKEKDLTCYISKENEAEACQICVDCMAENIDPKDIDFP